MKQFILKTLLLAQLGLLLACSPGGTPQSTLADLKGQWVVINYWAKWCKPCIEEIPELNKLDQQYPGVTVLGVNFDGATGEALATQIESLGIEFEILALDPAASLQQPRPVVLPSSIILDPSGKVSQTLIGPQTTASLALATQQSP